MRHVEPKWRTASFVCICASRATARQAPEPAPADSNGQFQTNSNDWIRDTFIAPGAPRAGCIGVRYRFKA